MVLLSKSRKAPLKKTALCNLNFHKQNNEMYGLKSQNLEAIKSVLFKDINIKDILIHYTLIVYLELLMIIIKCFILNSREIFGSNNFPEWSALEQEANTSDSEENNFFHLHDEGEMCFVEKNELQIILYGSEEENEAKCKPTRLQIRDTSSSLVAYNFKSPLRKLGVVATVSNIAQDSSLDRDVELYEQSNINDTDHDRLYIFSWIFGFASSRRGFIVIVILAVSHEYISVKFMMIAVCVTDTVAAEQRFYLSRYGEVVKSIAEAKCDSIAPFVSYFMHGRKIRDDNKDHVQRGVAEVNVVGSGKKKEEDFVTKLSLVCDDILLNRENDGIIYVTPVPESLFWTLNHAIPDTDDGAGQFFGD